MRHKYLFILVFISILSLAPFVPSMGQCSMCRAGAGSNIDSKKNNVGAGLNTGILYLMSIPYIIGGVVGIVWFARKKQIKAFLNSNAD